MLRILIVEDVLRTLQQLTALLSETFTDAKIDKAETVTEAHRRIEDAFNHQRPYQAVILDLMLPKDIGDNPEADESVYALLCDKMPQAVIALTTAYFEDEKGRKHLQKVDAPQPSPPAFAQKKQGADWGIDLIRKLKAELYGRPIRNRLRSLFARSSDRLGDDYQRLRRSRTGTGGSLTHEIASLVREIENHWRDLDSATQEEIRNVFVVDDDEDGVRAGLL